MSGVSSLPAYFPDGPDTGFVNITVEIDRIWRDQKVGAATRGSLFARGLDPDEGVGSGVSDEAIYTFQGLFTNIGDEGFAEAMGVQYAATEITGRGEPYQTFQAGESKQIALTFCLEARQAESEEAPYARDNLSPFHVMFWTRWFEALKQPIYHADPAYDRTYAPPPVILTVGRLLIARCLVTAVDSKWLPPFEPGTMYPHGAELGVTFTVVRAAAAGSYSYGGKNTTVEDYAEKYGLSDDPEDAAYIPPFNRWLQFPPKD